MIKVALIAAMSNNRVIGRDNSLPWHLPEDLKFFKARTVGCPVIMGRKTFESIGRPLPKRKNIVITRQVGWQSGFSESEVTIVSSIEDAIAASRSYANEVSAARIMIIGGAQVYQQAIAFADEIYLTKVDVTIEGDAFFPELNSALWEEKSREQHLSQDEKMRFAFCHYARRG